MPKNCFFLMNAMICLLNPFLGELLYRFLALALQLHWICPQLSSFYGERCTQSFALVSYSWVFRYSYSTGSGSFTDAPRASSLVEANTPCPACADLRDMMTRESLSVSTSLSLAGEVQLFVGGAPIHVNDFIYASPISVNRKTPEPFRIGQVRKIFPHHCTTASANQSAHTDCSKNPEIEVSWLLRRGDLNNTELRGKTHGVVTSDQVLHRYYPT